MKTSQFNSIVPLDGKFVLYNTLNNNLMLMDDYHKDLLEAAKREDVESLRDFEPDFFEALKNEEFIVENELDEVAVVKAISRRVDFNDNEYRLTVNPTMNCNFKCWYCYETHVKDSRMNEDIVERTNKFISNILEERRKIEHFTLSWFGGEPLLYFYDIVLPIIKHFNAVSKTKGIQKHINFTTNGFLISEKMVTLLQKNGVDSMQITLDGSREEHDKVRYVSSTRGSFDQIIQNVILLLKGKIYVRLRINYTSKNLQSCFGILNDLVQLEDVEKRYLLIDFHRVWQDADEDVSSLLSEIVTTFRANNFEVLSNFTMNSVRDSCYADKKNSAVINYNGDVFKCTARDFTNVKREGYIDEQGAIVWEDNSLEKRMNSKFTNRPCLSCRLLPVCNGGCSQHLLEHLIAGEEYCIFSYDERKKDEVVMAKIEEVLDSVSL